MEINSKLQNLFAQRDYWESMKNRYFPNHLPEIERNDEIDYEIDRLLKD